MSMFFCPRCLTKSRESRPVASGGQMICRPCAEEDDDFDRLDAGDDDDMHAWMDDQ